MFSFWIALCVVAAVFAAKCGRNPIGWFVVSFLLSPLIAGLLLIVLPAKRATT